jgi:hypothetical protein
MVTPLDPELARQVALLDADQREWFEERCAIREYDGGLPRAQAEHLAWSDLQAHFGSLLPALPRQPDRT